MPRSNRPRKTLTINPNANKKKSDQRNRRDSVGVSERSYETIVQPVVNSVDFLLPCRNFIVDFKVADTKQLSITLEYLLRAIRVLGRLREEELAEFYNYNRKELEFVLSEGLKHEYIEWKNGEVELAAAGRKLFEAGHNIPRSMELQSYSSRVGFDLLSLSYEPRRYLSKFETFLPELDVEDTSFITEGTRGVPEVFKKNYFDIMVSDDRLKKEMKGLYSVDKVAAGDRFSVLVPVEIRHDKKCVGQPDFDLKNWKDEADLGSRQAVSESISSYLSTLCRSRSPRDQVSFDVFSALIGDALSTSAKSLIGETDSAEMIHQKISEHVLSENGNSAFFGSPFIPQIGTELIGAVKDGILQRDVDQNLSWLIPNAPAWGMTQKFMSLIDGIQNELTNGLEPKKTKNKLNLEDVEKSASLGVEWFFSGKLEKHVVAAFQQHDCVGHELSISNNLVEIIVCSNAAVLIALHIPPLRGSAMPTPLGVISSDQIVVEKAQEYLSRLKAAGQQ